MRAADSIRQVGALFQSDADFWRQVYGQSTVFATVIQRRQAFALKWIDRLPLAPLSPVLEVGCGAGILAVALAERGLSVTALDLAPAMLAQTRGRAVAAGVEQRVHVCRGDAHALEFESGSFELVTALGVLPWLHDPATAVAEMARVLRPGGSLIVSVDNRASLAALLDPARNPMLQPLKSPVKRLLRRSPEPAGVGPRADRVCHVDRLLGRARLDKVAAKTCGFGPLSIFHRQVVPASVGLVLERGLQALADGRVPGIRSAGWHYMVWAKKRPDHG